jgi:hypothetical protein
MVQFLNILGSLIDLSFVEGHLFFQLLHTISLEVVYLFLLSLQTLVLPFKLAELIVKLSLPILTKFIRIL